MKNLFDWNSQSFKRDGSAFVTESLSDAVNERKQMIISKCNLIQQRSELPLPFQIIEIILWGLFIFILLAIGKSFFEDAVTFRKSWENAWFIYIIGLCSGIGIIACGIVKRLRERSVAEKTDLVGLEEDMDNMLEDMTRELKIPDSLETETIDVLSHVYKIQKDGKLAVINKRWYNYENEEFMIYKKDGCICFTDLSCVYSVPISEISGLKRYNKRLVVSGWNKNLPPNSPEYKKYAIQSSNAVYIKGCCSFRISSKHGEFEIIIPEYDVESFLKMAELSENTLIKEPQ